MELQLDLAENIPDAIRHLATEQVKIALDQLTASQFGLDERIHTTRKSFKKVRSILRLVRDEIGEDVYHHENLSYRDAGRLLAPMRDSSVLVKTLDDITERLAHQLNAEALKSVRAQLLNHQDHVRLQTINSRIFPQLISTLDQSRTRIKKWSIPHTDFSAFHTGIKRVYKRGYVGMDTAATQPTNENLHEWRKRIKYLWYHTRLLKDSWPTLLDELASELHILSDYLGDDHDLAEFSRTVLHQSDIIRDIDPTTRQALTDLISNWRSDHQTHAFSLGKRIYAEKPESFAHRIAAYWQSAQLDLQKIPTP